MEIWGECSSLCKGPEAVTCLDYLRNSREADIIEVKGGYSGHRVWVTPILLLHIVGTQ